MTKDSLIEELVEALEPFAVAADAIDKEFPNAGDHEIYKTVGPNIREYGEWGSGPDCRFLTYRNFRRTREALSRARAAQTDSAVSADVYKSAVQGRADFQTGGQVKTMIVDEVVEAGAKIIAASPLIEAPKLDWPCWCGLSRKIIEAAVLAERARCAKIAETEEELEGAPPFEMSAESIHVARAIVRATKKSIARRIRAEPKDNSNE